MGISEAVVRDDMPDLRTVRARVTKHAMERYRDRHRVHPDTKWLDCLMAIFRAIHDGKAKPGRTAAEWYVYPSDIEHANTIFVLAANQYEHDRARYPWFVKTVLTVAQAERNKRQTTMHHANLRGGIG